MSSTRAINFLNFNQIGSCISMGTSEGFEIFNCDPFGKFYSDESGGYGIVEMLFSTSLLAVVGVGDQPAMSPRRLRIINTKRHSVICEVTFPSTIQAVKMNKARLIVLLQDQIYIYDISTMRLLHTIETATNLRGLIAVSPSLENNYLAYPSPPKVIKSEIKGHATTNNISLSSNDVGLNLTQSRPGDSSTEVGPRTTTGDLISGTNQSLESENAPITSAPNHSNSKNANSIMKNGDVILFNMQTLQPTMVIEAHKGEIAALVLSRDGTLLATASEKGTILRVFSVETGSKVYQFRRGTYPTKIYSMCFSDDNQFLAASSSSKTVHIFKLGKAAYVTGNVDANNSDLEDQEADDFSIEELEEGEHEEIASLGQSSSASFDSAQTDTHSKEPVVDASRRTVGRMIRNSSQKLSRKAAKTLGAYFPIKVTSILEPSRHFASLKLPIDSGTTIKSITTIGQPVDIDATECPELFENSLWGSSANENKPNLMKMVPVRVISSDGYMYNYVLDPERGGDCLLLSQFSLVMY
ncbi:LANO_0G14950g1_1 [Lachancea nothofagi CBS 11611]|uniref:LANO_0G14950g1_1 n=1 Tax=Lachancea nothofagi CBS 11611 TaxID=1266666 RepID=A0A1G4KK62_9SACH|nr:LANO_0G14950g1_1 [Lachancea nothofagi CBS 11611]